MNLLDYKKKLEIELITEFRNKFFETLGYHPTIVTNKRMSSGDMVVLTLPELEKYFEPHLPTVFGKKLNLRSKYRGRTLVELRCIFFFIGRTMHYGLQPMAEYLGKKDHSTVIHNINTFKNLYETDPRFKEKYYSIINEIKKDYESPTLDPIDQMEC